MLLPADWDGAVCPSSLKSVWERQYGAVSMETFYLSMLLLNYSLLKGVSDPLVESNHMTAGAGDNEDG